MTEEKKETIKKVTKEKVAEKDTVQDKTVKDEVVKFKGKYISTTGKRKTSVARVRLYKNGNGYIVVNGLKAVEYFSNDKMTILRQPLKLAGHLRDLNFSVVVRGGGKKGQSEAVRHGFVRALIEMNEELKPSFKAKGWTTRDARKKERKKPGLKKSRKAPQWSKR